MSKKSSNFARYFHYYRILGIGYRMMEKGKVKLISNNHNEKNRNH